MIAGAGMAGLCAAARAVELGARPLLLEKGDRPGGSMRLSSGFVWRYRDFARFRAECPGGDPHLQRLLHERLDGDLAWLESLGASVVARETGNPLTAGVRLDPRTLTDVLVRRSARLHLSQPLERIPEAPLILATGGFQGSPELVRRYVTPHAESLWLRANPWSVGDGLRLALARGAGTSAGLDEFYGRNLPAPPARVTPAGFISLQQLYAHHAVVVNRLGERYVARTWSEIDVVQWTARQPGARAWYLVSERSLEERVRERTVREMVEAARAAGGSVERRDGAVAVEVAPGITTTLGGLRIDERARVLDPDGAPLAGLYAAGTDAGGIATGGYASGLAAALVFGKGAAESALAA